MFYIGQDYLRQPRPKETWLVKDLLPAGGFLNIYGKPKAGKSFLALGQAIAISSGMPQWMGIPVMTHGRVAYIQIDTPRSLWMERLDEITENHYNIDNIAFADKDTCPAPFNILTDGPLLREQLLKINPIVVYLDTIRELHSGDENDSSVMKNVIAAIDAVCRPAAVVLLSHKKKEGSMHADDLMADNRGSSYVAGRMDGVISVVTQKGNDHRGSMAYQSRKKGHTEVKMMRSEEDGLWRPDEAEQAILSDIAEIMAQMPGASVREYGRVLAEKWKCKEETARSRFRSKQEIFLPRLVAVAK